MKITFILSAVGISGGSLAVFRLANYLTNAGHLVRIVYPLVPLGAKMSRFDIKWIACSIKGTIGNIIRGPGVKWFDVKAEVIRATFLDSRYIPDADVVVATYWQTAYYVNKLPAQKGEKYYLVQHYEIWCGEKNVVDESYRLGLKNIVHSNWLRQIMEQDLKVPVAAFIPHAPDWSVFYPEAQQRSSRDGIRVLIPYRKEKWKGAQDGIKAFEIARRQVPDLRLVMFGPRIKNEVPSYAEFHENISNDRLRSLYNSCDIFLLPSHAEGFAIPPMEAMACKCAVISTRVGAVPDYSIPGQTALLCGPGDIKEMAGHIVALATNKDMRQRIAAQGHIHIKNYTWERAGRQLEELFRKYPDKKSGGQTRALRQVPDVMTRQEV